MELGNRGVRPSIQQSPVPTGPSPQAAGPVGKKINFGRSGGGMPQLFKIGFVALLFAGSALIVALALSFSLGGKPVNRESQFVAVDKYQAIFLNGGQVYFGKISDFNDQYIRLADIYYLRVQQQVQPGSQEPKQDISLAKLGSELHGPEDSMVINRDQVIFWENLKDDGQVVKAIIEYKKDPAAADKQSQTPPSTTTPTTTTPAPTTTTPTTKKP